MMQRIAEMYGMNMQFGGQIADLFGAFGGTVFQFLYMPVESGNILVSDFLLPRTDVFLLHELFAQKGKYSAVFLRQKNRIPPPIPGQIAHLKSPELK
jgi:hypothetical protein